MKKISFIIVVFLFLPVTVCWPNDDLAGIWSATIRTKGGLGGQWIFSKDGKASYIFGALVDFFYEIKNDQIRIDINSDKKHEKVPFQRFEIKDKRLIFFSGKSSTPSQIMERIGQQNNEKQPILGDWTYDHYTGGKALMRFSSKGVVQLSVPFTDDKGTYSIKKDQILISLKKGNSIAINYKKKGKILLLDESGDNNIKKYKLFEY